MDTLRKKRTEKKLEEPKHVEMKAQESQAQSAVVPDVVTKSPENIKIVDPVSPEPVKSAPSAEPAANPLTDFKQKMKEEDYSASYGPARKNFMWPILFVFVLALAMLGGIFIYKKGGANKPSDVNVVTLSPTPQPSIQPTAEEVDLTKYEIKILNGSETEGEAGRQKNNLEEEGFTVSSIGNASESDYTETIIQAKKTVDKDFLEELKKVLELSFKVGSQEELSEDADSDVIVIIGSEKN